MEEQNVLRTHFGERVFDAEDVDHLVAVAHLAAVLAVNHAMRQRTSIDPPRNVREAHARETGHLLSFGCCQEKTAA